MTLKDLNKKPFIRLRHVALAALVVAVIATISSFGLTYQDLRTIEWFSLACELVMWGCLALLAYTYIGYPIVLTVLARFLGRRVEKGGITPSVSVLLAAYNEEAVIQSKIENLLSLNYPSEFLEILIGSDGSDDQTAEIARAYNDPRIRVLDFKERRGKTSVLNRLAPLAKGKILIFTDASERFDTQAVRRLVENFADPKVGAVSGQLMMTDSEANGSSRGVSTYWKYEKKLRELESRLHSMLGATGAIYAMRRELYEPPPNNTILDDVAIPLGAVQRGYRVVFEAEALAYERATDKGSDEFKRKVRTLTGNYQEYFHLEKFLSPNTIHVFFQVFSHKILRLLAPLAMIAMMTASFLATSPMATAVLSAQIVFYCLAFLGLVIPRGKARLFSVPYMFCLMNTAALMAFFRYFFLRSGIVDGRGVLWEKTKENLGRGSVGFDLQGGGDALQLAGSVAISERVAFYLKVKPVMDFALATASLTVAAPAMAFVALAIRLESRGPVVYRQQRVGRDGKPFTIYKFRSMVVNAEKNTGAVWATRHDPRVTHVGRFIRETHLDELPQLLNVLRGDMSMIGPRPERPEFVRNLSQQIEGYNRRLSVKPGITGLAQVHHKYDETLQDVRGKVKHDLRYIETACLKTDVKILLLTAKKMIGRQNPN